MLLAARSIKADLDLAEMSVHVIRFSTTSITSTWLLPESVARIAAALNYFLMHLTGKSCLDLPYLEVELDQPLLCSIQGSQDTSKSAIHACMLAACPVRIFALLARVR